MDKSRTKYTLEGIFNGEESEEETKERHLHESEVLNKINNRIGIGITYKLCKILFYIAVLSFVLSIITLMSNIFLISITYNFYIIGLSITSLLLILISRLIEFSIFNIMSKKIEKKKAFGD